VDKARYEVNAVEMSFDTIRLLCCQQANWTPVTYSYFGS